MFLFIKRGTPGLLNYGRNIIIFTRGYKTFILDIGIIIINSDFYKIFGFR